MTSKFEKVRYYYDNGIWQKSNVRDAVSKGWITAEEYGVITGEKYEG